MPKHHEEKKAHKKGAGLKLIGSPNEIINILIDGPEENKWALNQILNEGPEHKQVHSALLLKRMYKLVKSVEKISGSVFSAQKGNEIISEKHEHEKAMPVQLPFSVVSRDRAGEVLLQRKLSGSGTRKIQIDDLVIDIATRNVSRDGKEISLTTREFVLLEYLARNANRVMSKNQILENVWEMEFDPESNIIEVYMYQLRKKIDKGFDKPLLETVVGSGYKLKGNKL